MVSTCCIRNCRNRSHDQRGKRVNEVQFFSFPVWKQSSGSLIAALTKSRRTAWVEAVKQSNITFDNISRHKFVCSRHFHSGKPAYEMLQSHRDWVPSLHLGHTKGKASLTVNSTEPAAPPDLAVPKSHVEEAATKENTGERQAVSNGHVYKDSSVTGGEIVSPCTAVALISVLEHVTTNQTGCIGTRGNATCATESPDNTETRCSSQAHIKETLERRVSQHVNYSSLSKASPTLLCPGTSKPVSPELFCDPDSTTCVSFRTTHTSPVKVKLEPQHNAFGEPSTEAKQGDAGEEMEVCDVSGEQDAVVGSQDRLTDAVSAVSTDRAGRARSTGSVDVDEVMELADVEQTRPEAPAKVDDKRMPIEEQSSDLIPAVVNIVSLRKDTRSLAVMEGEHISNGAPGFKDEVEPEQLSSSSERRAVPTENVQIMVGDAIKQETFEMEDETTTRPFSQSSTGSKVSRRPASSVPLVKVKDEPVDEEYHSAQIPDPSEEEEPNSPAFNLKISAVYSLRKVSTQSETPGDVVPLPQAAEVTTSPPAPAAPTRASCSTCRKVLLSGQTAFQKKGSKELYCCNACLSSHIQPIIKLKTQCHYCRKVIESLSEVIVVPVDRTGAMKNFCSNMCIFNCTRDSAPPVPSSAATVAKGPPSQCSHCAKSCTSKHDVNMKGSVHKLCSDQCFIGFHADHTCCNCSQYCYAKVLTMRLENVTKTFCKAECVTVYRQRFKTPSSCAMCGAARPVCDMVEVTGADDKVDLFCTGSCGEAYKLQTGSASECAHCHKVSAPAYHLARSHGSPWSFCTLSCVIAFQGNMGKTKHRATMAVPTPNRTTIASPTPITVPPPTRTTVPPPTVTIVPPPIRANVSFPTPITVPPPTRANVSPPVLPATTSPSTTTPAVDDVKLSCSQCCKFISSRPEPVQHKSELGYFCGDDCSEEFKQIHFDTKISAEAPDTALGKNSVRSLIKSPFLRRSLVAQLKVKELGPDKPDLRIRQEASKKGQRYLQGFPSVWYKRKAWLAGCRFVNAVFCFPCLLFKTEGTDTTWTVTGVRDMKHIAEKIKKHECTRAHMKNSFKLAMLGRVSIATQLDQGLKVGVKKHNQEVFKNRHILSKVIDGVKFCEAFEQALRSRKEIESSDHPGGGLVDLEASLGAVLEEHLKMDTVFKGGSETVQNEVLDCMLSVLRDYIVEEVKKADYLAIQLDETTDHSARCQLALLLRYVDGHDNVQERFFEFLPLQNATANTIATALLERLADLLPEGQEGRLIAQAHDGAGVTTGATAGGVQGKVKAVYRNAHLVHSYAHPTNLVMQRATSHVPKIGMFFSDLEGFAAFFSRSSKRTAVLDQVMGQKLPGTSTAQCDFHCHAVTAVYRHKDVLLQCFRTIRDSSNFDPATVREAGGFVRMLEDQEFCFFLTLFYMITPHVDTLFNQLQKRDIDPVCITKAIQMFTDLMKSIRDCIPSVHGEHSNPVQQHQQQQQQQHAAKRRRTLDGGEHQMVCNFVLQRAKECFSFTNHLVSATMLLGDLFRKHSLKFPETALELTAEAYPMLNKAKLRRELSLLYENEDFAACSGALALLRFFRENDLQGTFTETVSLLKIVVTTPMTTAESERCPSTSCSIRNFMRNTVTRGRPDALAMLAVERELIRTIPDFNNRVVEKFAAQTHRKAKLMYK